ncbi:alkaline phosphatase family protein [Prevotella sp. OH937_COT-195]|uniref:alkaline phosphatase family protein n=1 Tax=Prevotella sp. OH937_COT-195 TaxID=2491051 RepID=UPI000F64EFFC|nr:alkaline phosphatase family protein [Prevotella sp. OH937_COT-195]RRD00902.1 alkaline phosphatase family protein [Prevotella sp. OH937_COT-195]
MRDNLLKFNRRYLTATLLAIISTGLQAQQNPKPRLVINIVINQMTSECLDSYSGYFEEGGFRRLIESGKVFATATMPFAPVDIASAITSIYTGTTPYYNGIANSQWLDRHSLKVVSCVDDSKYSAVGTYSSGSASNVLSSMIGDELKAKTENRGKVYAIAAKREAAILSACHYANCAFWIDDITRRWSTSTYYPEELPNWLPNIEKQEDEINLSQNNYLVANAAISCIANFSLGKDDDSDILALTFDVSDELATYKELDKDISRLVKMATSAVGEENLLVITTGTGLYPPQNIDYAQLRIPHGTYYINRSAKLLELYLNAIYDQGKYVEGCMNNQIYLNTKLAEQKKIEVSEMLNRSQMFLLESSGVGDVFTKHQLLTAGSDMLATMRNSFNSNTCGDLIIVTQPGWKLLNEENKQEIKPNTTSATFPIIIWGSGIKPERLETHVSAERISPTISKAIRIRAPNACVATPLI